MFENAAPVDIAVAPSVEEFADRWVRHEQPVIVRDGLRGWPPRRKWSLEYLKEMSGTRRVKVGVSTDGGYVEFARVIDDIFSPGDAAPKYRVHQISLKRWSTLDEDASPPPYVRGKIIARNIWMASTGNVTRTHYDMEDNINVQLRGRKEVILYPSTQLDELYPRSPWDYMSNFSGVEIESPDLSRFPLFRRATPLRAVLEPGDFLYLPIYWWHQFRTLEASLNVNFWWQPRTAQTLRRHGLRYWPRMARDGYLHVHVARTVINAGRSLFAR